MKAVRGIGWLVSVLLVVLHAAAPRAEACDTCAVPGGALVAPTLVCQFHSGSTDAACPSDFYDVALVAGRSYVFTLCTATCAGASASYDSRLRILDPSCVVLQDIDDSCGLQSEITLTTTVSGTYRVEVTGFSAASVGSYNLGYREVCLGGDCASPDGQLNTPLTTCQVQAGDLGCGERFYSAPLTQGQSYTFTLCDATCAGAGAAFNSVVELFNPGGTLVASNDNACGDDAEVVYQTPGFGGNGDYCVRISSADGSTGPFALGYRVSCQPPSDVLVSPPGGGATSDDCSVVQNFTASTAGTGPFNWSWTIVPSPPNTANPTSGSGNTDANSFAFASTLTGVGTYTVQVNVSNECGSDDASVTFVLDDRRGPDIVCSAQEVSCPPPLLRKSGDRPEGRVVPAPEAAAAAPLSIDRAAVREALLSSADPERAAKAVAEKLGLKASDVVVHDGHDPRFFRAPGTEALSCPSPCQFNTLQADNPFYEVFLDCDDGDYTARTGALHSVTLSAGNVKQNVIYGGQSGSPGTSDLTFYVHNNGFEYQDPTGGQACAFDPPDTANEPQSIGLEAEWSESPMAGINLLLREEIVAFGSIESNSGIRLTLGVTNRATSTQVARMGVRWQIDYQNASDDGPLYAGVDCNPFDIGPDRSTEHEFAPGEIQDFYRIRNNTSSPIFGNFTNTTPILGFPDTGTPDRLIYGYWPSMVNSPWNYLTTEGDPRPDSDSAVLYFFGYSAANAIAIAPGESFTRSVVIFTAGDAQDCGTFTPGSGTDATVDICPDQCAEIGATATDNCSTATVQLAGSSPGAPACVGNPCIVSFPSPGTYVYTWEATDTAANTTTCTSTVHVRDLNDPLCGNRPPTCDAGGPYASPCRDAAIDGASVSDPDGDTLTYTWTSSRGDVAVTPAGGSAGSGALPPAQATLALATAPCDVVATLTLTVDDGNGGVASCETTVGFDDNTAPMLSGVPADATVSCESVPAPATPTASDDCDTDPAIDFTETRIDGNCPDSYQIVRTWTAIDHCGNQSTAATQTLTVQDLIAPVLSGVPADATVSCESVPAPANPTATDNCDPDPDIAFTETRIDGNCPDNYQLVRTWTATDRCGNSVSDSQTVTVRDLTPPVLDGVPADATVSCESVPAPASPTASDNCDPDPDIDFTEIRIDGNCPDNYQLVRTWTATDRCGNSASQTQTVTVRDLTPPVLDGVPADATVSCESVPGPANPTASDNCDPDPAIDFTETRIDGNCPDNYQLVRTWTATDRCGNSATDPQVVTVRDLTPPVPVAALLPVPPSPPASPASPRSATAPRSCSPPSSGRFQVVCSATDNCDPAPLVSAVLHVVWHEVAVPGGPCETHTEDVPVACGELVDIRLLAPPCPARRPRSATSAPPPISGVRVVAGEEVTLVVTAVDRCGNSAEATADPTDPPTDCTDPLPDGTCCPVIGRPPDPSCDVPVCLGIRLDPLGPNPPRSTCARASPPGGQAPSRSRSAARGSG